MSGRLAPIPGIACAFALLIHPHAALAYPHGTPASICPGDTYLNPIGLTDGCIGAGTGGSYTVPGFLSGAVVGIATPQQSPTAIPVQKYYTNYPNGLSQGERRPGIGYAVGYRGALVTVDKYPFSTVAPQCVYAFPLLTCSNWAVGITVGLSHIDFHDSTQPTPNDVSLKLAANDSGNFVMTDFYMAPSSNAKTLGYAIECNGCGLKVQDYEHFEIVDQAPLINPTPPTQGGTPLTQDILDNDNNHTIIMKYWHIKPSGRPISGTGEPNVKDFEFGVLEGLSNGSSISVGAHGEIDQYTGINAVRTSQTYNQIVYFQPNTPTEVTAELFGTGNNGIVSYTTFNYTDNISITNFCSTTFHYDGVTCPTTGKNVGLAAFSISYASIGTLNVYNNQIDYTGTSNTGHGCWGSGSRIGAVGADAFQDDGLGGGSYDAVPGNTVTITSIPTTGTQIGWVSGMTFYNAGAGLVPEVVTSPNCTTSNGCTTTAASGPFTASGPPQAIPPSTGWLAYPTIGTLNASGNVKLLDGTPITISNGASLPDNCS